MARVKQPDPGTKLEVENTYQDVDSDDSELESCYVDEDTFAKLVQAESAFSVAERDTMHEFLRERGLIAWLKEYLITRQIPISKLLLAFEVVLSPELQDIDEAALLPRLKNELTRFLRRRVKLPQYSHVSDVINLIRQSNNIMVLTGAGISVSCGVPDFRSANGLYAMLDNGEYNLDDPQQMFDIEFFKEKPEVFFSFARKIYPTNFIPSPSHRFVKLLEDNGKLLRNYTQNIDTIETLCGVKKVLQCHGSFATATCMDCRRQVPGIDIKDDILAQRIPRCTSCHPAVIPKPKKRKRSNKKKEKGWGADDDSEEELPLKGIMKPDITFFGEKLSDEFDHCLYEDRESVDLLLVIGTSLKVAPVSEILAHIPHSIPQILINKTPVKHVNPDVVLLGESDVIIEYICSQLDWDLPPAAGANPKKRGSSELLNKQEPRRASEGHIWLFEGAEPGFLVAKAGKEDPSASNPDLKRAKLG